MKRISRSAGKRLGLVIVLIGLLVASGSIAKADSPSPSPSCPASLSPSPNPNPNSGPSPAPSLNPVSCQQLQNWISELDNELAVQKQEVSALQAQLSQSQNELQADQMIVAQDETQSKLLSKKIAYDKLVLAELLKASYEQGNGNGNLEFLVGANSWADFLERDSALQHLGSALQELGVSLEQEEKQLEKDLAEAQAKTADASLRASQQQTMLIALQGQEASLTIADGQAHAAPDLEAAIAALAAAKGSKVVYPVLEGGLFTEDSDLRQPSALSAAGIDAFLAGTPLAGLGASFKAAESKYHVSANWLISDAILESAFGSSALAIAKNNLFGFGANDANPFVDAQSFTSFQDCIMQVAAFVDANYLSNGEQYYHGASMRGMNVDYATDPDWAIKLQGIAQSIPENQKK